MKLTLLLAFAGALALACCSRSDEPAAPPAPVEKVADRAPVQPIRPPAAEPAPPTSQSAAASAAGVVTALPRAAARSVRITRTKAHRRATQRVKVRKVRPKPAAGPAPAAAAKPDKPAALPKRAAKFKPAPAAGADITGGFLVAQSTCTPLGYSFPPLARALPHLRCLAATGKDIGRARAQWWADKLGARAFCVLVASKQNETCKGTT